MESLKSLQQLPQGPDFDVLALSGLQRAGHQSACAVEEEIDNRTRPIVQFLLDNVPEYVELVELRRSGWKNRVGHHRFKRQRRNADRPNAKTSQYHFGSMKRIGDEINRETSAFTIGSDHGSVLDFCVAPGGFLATAERINPTATFAGFSLPPSEGGYPIELQNKTSSCVKLLDITMLSEDMGRNDAETDHPDANNFLPRQLKNSQQFDLVICDGNLLRNQTRAANRRTQESLRLQVTQLALGLEHLKAGGTMIVLLKKVESWDTVCFIHRFNKFSSIKLYKPECGHKIRSSFYLVASNIQSQHPEALLAIAKWKSVWSAVTFGTEEKLANVINEGEPAPEILLEEFGATLIEQGSDICFNLPSVVGVHGQFWGILSVCRFLVKSPLICLETAMWLSVAMSAPSTV
ncbi:FtsJ-like methyltransferase family protein [Cordyceps javanica]|uniref:FtsJ-like methyltransferase family protein n=1 Tax=Cordyceps javanica TaxID=43265 RepID=A0A545UL67_9HYPO|nr:FtsJ-like methyltransferase family protein [Cordyceps javanica]